MHTCQNFVYTWKNEKNRFLNCTIFVHLQRRKPRLKIKPDFLEKKLVFYFEWLKNCQILWMKHPFSWIAPTSIHSTIPLLEQTIKALVEIQTETGRAHTSVHPPFSRVELCGQFRVGPFFHPEPVRRVRASGPGFCSSTPHNQTQSNSERLARSLQSPSTLHPTCNRD